MDKVWAIFTKKQHSIGSAAIVLVCMVFLSRVLGLVRDRLLSQYFGPEELGVYFAAFRLPNALFELLVMGALTSAFIPVYSRYIAKNDTKNAQILSSSLINLSLVVFFFLAIPIFIGAEWVSRFMTPGFSPDQIRQMSAFTRFMILFQVGPLLIGNVFTGILQSHNLFLVPAAAPVLYNIGIIIGIVLFSHSYGLWGAIIGVGIGALFFALIQIPLLIKLGYRHNFSLNPKHSGVKEVGRLMGPRTFGLAISQIDTTIDLMMASLLGARMVTIFNFAQHLQQLPVGLFGTTIAQAALPSLSKISATEDHESFINMIVNAIHQILFLVLPVSVLFIVLRIPVVRLVFGAAQFDWSATVATGMTLSAFSVSLFAQAIVQVLARAFYALYDSKTPVIIGIICVLINSFFSVLFVMYYKWPVWSLGVSASVSSITNAFLLLYYLNKRVKGILNHALLIPSLKMSLAALVTGVALYIPIKLLDQLVFDTTRTFGLLLLTGFTTLVGLVTYIFLSWVLGIEQVQSVMRFVKRVGSVRGIFLEPAQEVVSGGTTDTVS